MHFEGVFAVTAPRELVFGLVTDPNQISRCMPGLKRLDVKSESEFDAVVTVGLSVIRGDIALRFRMVEKRAPTWARMTAHGTGLGSAVDVEMEMKLTDWRDGGTSMEWTAEALISGRVASLGQGLVKSRAEKIIGDLFGCLEGRLG